MLKSGNSKLGALISTLGRFKPGRLGRLKSGVPNDGKLKSKLLRSGNGKLGSAIAGSDSSGIPNDLVRVHYYSFTGKRDSMNLLLDKVYQKDSTEAYAIGLWAKMRYTVFYMDNREGVLETIAAGSNKDFDAPAFNSTDSLSSSSASSSFA